MANRYHENTLSTTLLSLSLSEARCSTPPAASSHHDTSKLPELASVASSCAATPIEDEEMGTDESQRWQLRYRRVLEAVPPHFTLRQDAVTTHLGEDRHYTYFHRNPVVIVI